MMRDDWKLRAVRADSGFFDQPLLGLLEEHSLPLIIVARMTRAPRTSAAAIQDWTQVDEHYSAASLRLQLRCWGKERCFVVIRELEREDKSAAVRRLIEAPSYIYRVFVNNREEYPVELWCDYNQRARIEQRIEELEVDLVADGFCMKQFYATEAAFLSVHFAFNLLSLYQQGHRHPQREALSTSCNATQPSVPRRSDHGQPSE